MHPFGLELTGSLNHDQPNDENGTFAPAQGSTGEVRYSADQRPSGCVGIDHLGKFGGLLFVLYCSRDCRRAGCGCGFDGCANRRGAHPVSICPERKYLPIYARWRGGTPSYDVSQEAIPPAARVSAAGILLDRGWGRAPQPHAGEDGADILVTIRQIIEGGDDGQGRRQRQRRLWRHLEAGGPDRAGPPPPAQSCQVRVHRHDHPMDLFDQLSDYLSAPDRRKRGRS